MRALTKLCVKPSLAAICLMAVLAVSSTAFAQKYSQTNLVSDMPGVAAVTDPNLINPWGMSFSSSSPFWISDAGTGLSTLYKGDGSIVPLVVNIPAPVGSTIPSIPTGQVFNGTTNFVVTENGVSGAAAFSVCDHQRNHRRLEPNRGSYPCGHCGGQLSAGFGLYRLGLSQHRRR